jgi:hypothetical protein
MIKGHTRLVIITQASGAGGDTYANIRPPQGEVWVLKAAAASHDDVARTIAWQLNDTDTAAFASLYTEAAVTAAHYYHRDVGNASDLVLSYNCYLMYKIASMAAGKTITVNCAVERIVGARTDLGA